MTTYVYEAIPVQAGEKTCYFEIKQHMSEAPLTRHPEIGEPIRRVLLGSFGVLSSIPTSKPTSETAGSSCGPACDCH